MKKVDRHLYGLVLAGGRGSRMGTDKSLLQYHGITQVEYGYDLLEHFCSKVFVSNRSDQRTLEEHKQFAQIHDTYKNIGPLGGILSAMKEYPKAAWIVLACDLPFVTESVLAHLLASRMPEKMASAYESVVYGGCPDPLCAIYEPKIRSHLLKFLKEGYTCPRKILMHADIHLIRTQRRDSLCNVNTPEDHRLAVRNLNRMRHPS